MLTVADVVDHLADHMSPYLEMEQYQQVQQQIDNAIQVAMPKLAEVEITAPMVASWRKDHGMPEAASSTAAP
jgi:hypothetical protein